MPKVNRVNALIDAELDEVSRTYPGRVRQNLVRGHLRAVQADEPGRVGVLG